MTKEERAAIRDILKYIQKQPEAKHTAEGIAKYWIFQQRLEEKLETVLAAIVYLVNEGFLEKVQVQDNSSYYRVNQEKLKEIPQTLQRLNSSKSLLTKSGHNINEYGGR